MSKLFIEDGNNIKVPVAELGLVLNKQQAILGNIERDLILRTAGNIKIQVGNKFFDLPFNTDENNSTTTVSGVIILNSTSELLSLVYPGEGALIFIKTDSSFYIAVSNAYIKINQASSGGGVFNKIYLSFDESQSLVGDQKSTVLLNTGYIIDNITNITSYTTDDVYDNQLVFSLADGKHYQLIDPTNPGSLDSWKELYLSKSGGILSGALIIDATTSSSLQIKGGYLNTFLPVNETNYNGLFIGNDYTNGLAVWNNLKTTYISSQDTNGGTIKFLIGGSKQDAYNPLTIGDNSVGIGFIDYTYRLNVGGKANFTDSIFITNEVSSRDFVSGLNGTGTSLYKNNDEWFFEVDNLLVRNETKAVSDYKSNAINGSLILDFDIILKDVTVYEEFGLYANVNKVGRYTSIGVEKPLIEKVTYINVIRTPPLTIDTPTEAVVYDLMPLAYGFGDRNSSGNLATYDVYNDDGVGGLYTPAATHRYDSVNNQFVEDLAGDLVHMVDIILYTARITSDIAGINIGDMLYYKYWDSSKEELITYYVEVVNIIDDLLYLYSYNDVSLVNDLRLIRVGNITANECFIQLNSADNNSPFIEMANNISSFNNFVQNIYFENELVETVNETNSLQTRFKLGDLSNIIDSGLQLGYGNNQTGLYSDNAFIRGNIIANRLTLGNQLTWNGTTLTIADLETVKARTITGNNGLNGGGQLFSGNIVISHNSKAWVDKPDLTGNTVISNLIIDAYGHPTNWSTRTISTADIPENTNLYYTDSRVDSRIALQKGAASGIAPLNASSKIDSIYLPTTVDITETSGTMEFKIGGVVLMRLNSTGLYLKSGVEVYPNNF